MTEHVCKWKWDIVDNDAWFYCSGCKEPMGALEIEARLNATERLSAGVAETIKIFMQINSIEDYGYSYRCLCAYANILEGK